MSSDSLDITTFASRAAAGGGSGYWDIPEVKVSWAFEAGLPDPATFPIDDLVRISEKVLRSEADEALQYGMPFSGGIIYGYPGLRDLLAQRTNEQDGRDLDRKSVMLTSGGVQGIAIACRAFLEPGDVAAVEAPTWGAALSAVAQCGAEAIAIPLDDDGLRLDVLEEQLARLAAEGRRLKLLYTITTFNTPTGVSLSLERRERLVALARRWNFLMLEDNVYGDLRYDGSRIPTLLGLDDTGRVLRVDSFSKTLAPGLRLGWVTGHPDVLGALASVRGDLGVSQWTARIMAGYLEEGLFEPHIERVTALYRAKRDATQAALEAHCATACHWRRPEGGFFFWVELDDTIDGQRTMAEAMAGGVVCRPGERFFGDDDDSGRRLFRIAFTQVPLDEIERGIAVLGKAIDASRRGRS